MKGFLMDVDLPNTANQCVVCRKADGLRKWQLCDRCRSELVDQHAQRIAMMAPDHCLGCGEPRRLTPEPGEVYCPTCDLRFAQQRKPRPGRGEGYLTV